MVWISSGSVVNLPLKLVVISLNVSLLCFTTQGGSHRLPFKDNYPPSHKTTCTYYTHLIPSLKIKKHKCPQVGLLFR
ncbi:hypothetical protein E2C01_060590 [Portunus trituberculatus]|uniref:Uncharacterized protein n=1 Tax=Portunus trituberculatus TaxID=210409 RepID=A0A5B7HCI8_PORTR|nr:hypothetical protein [Portunus trituberculatus]